MADTPDTQDNATSQLANLPLGSLIGSPLNAAIEAQATAALSSINFIKQVALQEDGAIRSVVFKYEKEGQYVNLTVPVLTIVPIPYLRIDSLDVSFKANISASTASTETTNKTSSKGTDLNLSADMSWLGAGPKVGLSGSYSSKKDSASTRKSKYNIEYTMDVKLHAVQDDMPAGISRVLNILQDSINAKPVAATPPGLHVDSE